MYELKLKDRSIYLKWGTWAMREFCVENNITLDKYFEFLKSQKLVPFTLKNISRVLKRLNKLK